MRALDAGILVCGECHQLNRADGDEHPRCSRCGAVLHARRPNSLTRTWALLITAAILYIPANLLPIMTVNLFGSGMPATIMEGVVELVHADMFPIAMVVFVASILVPTFKLVGIALLLYSVQRHQPGALIEQAKLRQGDFVIVTAASSSVGLAAFQMARMVGATSIAITRTHAKKQALLDAGAAHVIVSDEEDIVERVMTITAGQGARVVFDPVGGPSFEPLTQSMARGGILLEYGALSSEPTPFPLFTVLGKSLTLKGYLYAEIVADPEALERAKAFILQGLESGALRPIIAKTFTLSDIQDAHRFLEANQQIGKIVVTV